MLIVGICQSAMQWCELSNHLSRLLNQMYYTGHLAYIITIVKHLFFIISRKPMPLLHFLYIFEIDL